MNKEKFLLGAQAAMPTMGDPEEEIVAKHAEELISGGLSNENRVAAFFANLGHESRDLNVLEENLYYSTPERLMQVWPSRFPTRASAVPYAKNPEGLANNVYADRMGNGNEASGEGWKYRGAGPIQLTGKYNYTKYGDIIDEDLVNNPDLARDLNIGLFTALAYFSINKIMQMADKEDWKAVTKAINGGYHGHDDREERIGNALAVMSTGKLPRRTVRRGSRGADVADVQAIVGNAPEDGIFGAGTEADVREWQANNMLDDDGVFGPASWAKAEELGLA